MNGACVPIRRLFTCSLLSLGLAACGDGSGALFADIQYATECEETRGCEPALNRDICGIDSGDPCPGVAGQAMLSCRVSEMAGDLRSLTFSASQGDFSIGVRQAIFPRAGGSAGGGSCRVTVVDGPNRYVGDCGSATPSEAQPCQISNVEFCDDAGNPTVRGNIFCQSLPNEASPLLRVEVHAKGAEPAAAMSPGTFRLANCDGLQVDDSEPTCGF